MESTIRILVIDDSSAIRDFVREAVELRPGFAVSEATDGEEGLQRVLNDSPDVILLDLEMPRLNGFQVIERMRAQDVDVPIILITSHGSEAIAVELFRKGVKDYLSKPFTADVMYKAIDRALTEIQLRKEKEALTERLINANRQLQQRVKEMDILYKIGKSVTSMLSREELMERILDAVFYVIGAEEATLMLVDEASNRLRTEVHRQRVPGELQEAEGRTAEQLAADAARKGNATATGAMLSAPLKVGDRVIGTLGLGNRVSDQPFSGHDRQLLMALADYAAIAIENSRLYEEIRQANQAKSEFVSFVAHELGTPMTSILGYTEVLTKEDFGPLSEQQVKFINTIRKNVERMQILVVDLQDISRMETGQVTLAIQPTPLSDAIGAALQATKMQIDARHQKLTVDVPENLPMALADPDRLVQVVINLLSNASKYTPEKGEIAVRAWEENGHLHCAVADTGIGISPENQARLFTKFFRCDDPAVKEQPGTGLGLCIVKNLVELQGGSIEVESTVGEGSTFRFDIPAAH